LFPPANSEAGTNSAIFTKLMNQINQQNEITDSEREAMKKDLIQNLFNKRELLRYQNKRTLKA
jgi:hypothetical protein